jgi:phospholipase C
MDFKNLQCFLVIALTALPWCSAAQTQATGLDKIEHIIVITLENRSFDNLFGTFPGVEGLAANKTVQTDHNGQRYLTLPAVMDTRHEPPVVDKRFPAALPNQPFLMDHYASPDETGDLVHRFYHQQQQINGGKMDRFAAVSNGGGLSMGYVDASKTGLWRYARNYTVADHFFQGAFGGSFLNHFWLICACTPHFDNAPDTLKAVLDAQGKLITDGKLTPNNYAVNTIYSVNTPHPPFVKHNTLLPGQHMPTIGDRLSEKGISWAWYSGGWNDVLAGKGDVSFQYHHQPFAYFKNFAEGTKGRKEHLKDERDLLEALRTNTLPAVVFYKPLGEYNLHPGYASITAGDEHITQLLGLIEQSPAWHSTVVIVTFDENGGYWDHVAPPVVDRWGPGARVPTLIISPFAKKHAIDSTVYDSTAIVKLIEKRFGLAPLTSRDARAADLSNSLILQ